MTSAFAILGLTEDATADDVKVAWRGFARVHHPDTGGKVEDFERYRAAFVEALEDATHRPCPTCKGSGTVVLNGGFGSLKKDCPTCR